MSDHAGFQAERRLSSDEDSRGGIDSAEASGCLDPSCDWSIDRDSLRIFLLGRDGRKPLFHRAVRFPKPVTAVNHSDSAASIDWFQLSAAQLANYGLSVLS